MVTTQRHQEIDDAGDDSGEATFGEWLDGLMTLRGLSNAELGRLIEVDGSHISKWRRDYQRPNSWNCRRIAEALGVPTRTAMIYAGHADPNTPFDDPIKDHLKRLIDDVPSRILEPYIEIFTRMKESGK